MTGENQPLPILGGLEGLLQGLVNRDFPFFVVLEVERSPRLQMDMPSLDIIPPQMHQFRDPKPGIEKDQAHEPCFARGVGEEVFNLFL